MGSISNFFKMLGPGILMAGAAIGVSHLVQATRAGASYGFSLFLLVFLVNLLKYPFFKFGHYYTIKSGQNLLEGYLGLGKYYLIFFLILNTITAITSISGVFFVTAALIQNIIPMAISTTSFALIILLLSILILGIGRYGLLDQSMKWMMGLLVITTLVAFIFALNSDTWHSASDPINFFPMTFFDMASLSFLMALMGWMPAPIELSVWQSLWIQEAEEKDQKKISMREAMFDFNFGYILTTVMALIFLLLGALIMYPHGENFPENPVLFAKKLLELYTLTVGDWMGPIVAVAAFLTMFSTALTVLDAYPRSVQVGLSVLKGNQAKNGRLRQIYSMVILSSFSLILILFFSSGLKKMVDLVTIISFISAPPFAYLNYKLIFGSQSLEPEDREMKGMKTLSLIGLGYLTFFALFYLVYLVRLAITAN